MMTISSIKISEEGFNDCPPREELEKKMKNWGIEEVAIPVDLDDNSSWKNDADTLVFSMLQNTAVNFGLMIGKIGVEFCADELDFLVIKSPAGGNVIVVRLWWD